jgi:4-alpha-glucanotransferase
LGFTSGRHAGLLLPLFSAPSRRSWGIGELADLAPLCAWLRSAGLDLLQVLPLNEVAVNDHSPYAAMSAMAIDPVYIALREVPDFQAQGGEASLRPDERRQLAAVRASRRVCYREIRSLKTAVLRASFRRFQQAEWLAGSRRARQLRAYIDRERAWLDDYTLFRALHQQSGERAWWDWAPPLVARERSALRQARAALADELLYHAYVQWLADIQWHDARRAAAPVAVFGDLSFMVGSDSADVWANQHAFRRDVSVGAPPDAFTEAGQDWHLPVYRWDVFAAEHDAWIRARARRAAALFDGYRIDHVVGFYRTYVIPADGSAPAFSPADEIDQLAQGERVMKAFLDAGATVIAEDLGVVPDFVRDSLRTLGIPGYKVFRWEREWDQPNRPFRDPAEYPPISVATTGTHDTETLADWWEAATHEERSRVADLPFLASRSLNTHAPEYDAATRDLLIEMLAASASNVLLLPVQDIFGWRDRINLPGTVIDANWTWRLPWPVDVLDHQPEARARADTLAGWMRKYGRSNLELQAFRIPQPS